MTSLKFLTIFSLIFWLALESSLINAATTSSNDEEFIKLEFIADQRKITVEGSRNTSWTGEKYFSFRAIPYAEPPVGELRFKDPQPLKELPSYIDARYEGHDCPWPQQKNGSEDCLSLNIYTPNTADTAKLPVIVFLHQGSLYLESGISSNVGPTYLLSKQVVVVTINYRLGALGFLQLGTREIPGNAGFKDQVQALRWVNKYIAHFGGNPQDVTLMGYSAGSRSVTLHLVSPMSQGLFHKAIAMSGVLQPQSVVKEHARLDFVKKQVKALNCPAAVDEKDILNCLNNFSGSNISLTISGILNSDGENPISLHRPIIERDFGQERFLVEDPYESMKRGAFAKVPILIGYSNGEYCAGAVNVYKNSIANQQFYEHFDEKAPLLLMYNDFPGNLKEINDALKDYYLPGFRGVTEDNMVRFCDFLADGLIRFGAQRVAELAAPHTKVFQYRFDYRGNYSSLEYPMKPARVEHMDDLMFLFPSSTRNFRPNSTDSSVIRLYTKFIYDFVKKGSELAGEIPTYPNGYTRVYKTLELQVGTSLATDTYALWKRLFL